MKVINFHLALCCIFQYEKQLVLVQVRWSAFMLYWERFKALVHLFVLGSLLGLLLLLLRVGEAGGDAGCRAAVAGPHGRLEHLHGVAPLAHRAAHGVQGRALAGQCARHRGCVLPRGLGRPGFGLVILTAVICCREKRRRWQRAGFLFTTAVFSPLLYSSNKVWP